jgi:hypothetical protein
MYKAFQNKKIYLAFNTFPKAAKGISNVYLTGVRNWVTDDMHNYSIVINRFRIIFGIKRNLGCGVMRANQ